METNQIILLVISICATAHLVMSSVFGLYSRHKVQYLALTWVMLIFSLTLIILAPFHKVLNVERNILHPDILIALTIISFFQSIYALSIPMPAYLQWGRMVKYAAPAAVLIAVYAVAWLCGSEPVRLDSVADIPSHLLSTDIWLRLLCLMLAGSYVGNILLLPRHMLHNAKMPRYVIGYCFGLGLTLLLFLACAIWYSVPLILSYMVCGTLLNMYLCYRTLETMAENLPKPVIEEVKEEPTAEVIAKAEKEDFNEANLQRFHRVEFWMQNHRDAWTQSTFNRDQLCLETGLNRHLLLQCLRSQGYNDTHEYLNAYRVNELIRLIRLGRVRTVSEASDAGFGTPKTARTVFEKSQGQSLDDFLAKQKKKENA